MRELPAAIIVSVVVNAAAVVLFARHDPAPPVVDPEVEPVDPPPAPAPTSPEPLPFELVVLDDQAASAAQTTIPLPAVSPPGRPSAGGAAISTGGASTAETGGTAEPSSAGGAPARSPLMTMRKPERRGLSSSFLDDFLARSKPLEPLPDLPGARLDTEIADLRARLRNPNRNHDADRIRLAELNEARKHVELQPDGGGSYKANKTTFVAKVDPDGKAHLQDKANLQRKGLGASFDVTDWAMRSAGIDPYAREKLEFLDRTRDQRVAIGREHKREVLSRSAHIMQRNIDRLWASAADLRARKQGLFELWDEVAETGDQELIAGGVDAREALADFIKIKLTGPAAYTADELARLNRHRRSKATFAPYD